MIKLIALDVDGTLTDGKIYTDDKDNNLKAFNVKDGFAIAQWIKEGGMVAIITGKTSNIVQRRADELGIQEVVQGVANKVPELQKLIKKLGITLEEVAYMGDDINDLGIMRISGISAAPRNAALEVLERVSFIATKDGGDGAVREFIEFLMKKNGLWERVINRYLNQK